MSNNIVIEPQKILVKDVEWSMVEIAKLKEYFGANEFVEFDKKLIRKDPVLKKALQSEIIILPSVQKGETAALHMTQVGTDLMGYL